MDRILPLSSCRHTSTTTITDTTTTITMASQNSSAAAAQQAALVSETTTTYAAVEHCPQDFQSFVDWEAVKKDLRREEAFIRECMPSHLPPESAQV